MSTFSAIRSSKDPRESNSMSPQVTFKSNDDKAPQADVDSAGRPILGAPRLRDAVRVPYTPSHGTAPSAMPQPPVGLEDLGPAAGLRVVGPDREKWLQGMQSNDLAVVPQGGAIAGAFLSGKGRLVAVGLLWRRHDEVLVTTEPERLDALRAHLDKHTTPIEGGLDPLLSFSKGCYVGQEVVAMATYRGRVAWNLVRLEVPGEVPAVGAKLGPGGKGRVTSATQVGAGALLLGYVR